MRGPLIVFILVAMSAGGATAQINCGDCNEDGFATDILDALTASRIAAMIIPPVGQQPCACDVDNDSDIDVIDALLMAQKSVALSVTLTCSAPTCGVTFNSPPEVIINLPVAGATVAGNVLLDFDTTDVDGDNLVVTIELSTNGGASFFLPMQAPGGTVAMNPTALVPAAAGQTYFWDSVAEAVGVMAPFVVVLRVSADDGTATGVDLVTVVVDQSFTCAGTLTCGTGFNLAFGMGPDVFPPPMFDFLVDSVPVEIDTSARTAGEAVDIFITNLSDDHDLWIGLPGTPCGDPDPANYRLASIGGGDVGMTEELQVFGDAALVARGEIVNVVVHHYDPNPTGTCDLVADCRGIDVCSGQIACGDPPLAGVTGTLDAGGALPASGLFSSGPAGDSFFFDVDFTTLPMGSGLEVSILNQTGPQIAGLLQFPDVPCGYPDIYSWSGVQSLNPAMDEDYFVFTPAELSLFPDGLLPMLTHNLGPGPATFDISLRCPALGPCEGTVMCGSSMVAGQIDMGTSYMLIGNQHTFGPGGDSDSWTLDLSTRTPGDDVTVTLRSLTSDCDLFLMPVSIDCGWPLPWNIGSSQLVGVGVDDVLLIPGTFLDGLTTDQLTMTVYRPDPAGAGDYDLSVACAPPVAGCMGTVEGTIDEALTPLPVQVMGDTTGADDTSVITCGVGGSVGDIDHVYEFIPAMSTTYSFSLCTSMYDTSLEIRDGNCSTGATVGCDDDACGPTFTSEVPSIPLTAGTTYYIVIDGWNGDFGAYTLDITTP